MINIKILESALWYLRKSFFLCGVLGPLLLLLYIVDIYTCNNRHCLVVASFEC